MTQTTQGSRTERGNGSPSVSVVIPSWNGRDLLEGCLNAVYTQRRQPDEIIVVDDGSTDDTCDHLAEHHPRVRVVRHETNLGFAAAVNTGIRSSTSDLVALLNNDAHAEPDWLLELVRTLQEAGSDVGYVTSKILRTTDGRIDTTGDVISTLGIPWSRGHGEKDLGQYDDACSLVAACAGGSLYRRDMLGSVGLFDERFFAYFEDVDLSLRALVAGWRGQFVPRAVLHHAVHATSAKRTGFLRYHTARNAWFVLVKNYPLSVVLRTLPFFLIVQLVQAVAAARHGELRAFTRAQCDAIHSLPSMLAARRRIRAEAVAPGALRGRLEHVPLRRLLGDGFR